MLASAQAHPRRQVIVPESELDLRGARVPGAASGVGRLPAGEAEGAERLDFGECKHGGVTGYRFKDEEHALSAKKHFDPKISGIDRVWRFLQGRTKSDGGNP